LARSDTVFEIDPKNTVGHCEYGDWKGWKRKTDGCIHKAWMALVEARSAALTAAVTGKKIAKASISPITKSWRKRLPWVLGGYQY
jgi:hypothetical protein